jgi:TolB-like protein/Tfp pilus assembly protein PilF
VAFVAELQRRKVFKVGIAYLVVGWLIIQVAATIAPQLNLPVWAPRLVTLIVLLGFPVALVLAWLLDATPEGLKLEPAPFGNKRIYVTAGILVALTVGWFVRDMVRDRQDADATLGAQSTAVLPFVNMSSDAENEHFSDGLTETLLHKLAQVPELKVAARTSSFAFKGKNEDIRSIGQALGVATVVEGSVQRAGDQLRITAQLVRTADGSHIWSRNYDRKIADLFAIQDEIAEAVTKALVGALLPEAKAAIAKNGTRNLVAYEVYTRALQHLARASYDSLDEAERLLESALQEDPQFVDAMVGLVSTWKAMSDTGKISRQSFVDRLTAWLPRIKALDPEHGLMLGFEASLARFRGDDAAADALFARALEVAPNDAGLRELHAQDLGRLGDQARVLAEHERAVELDPLNPSLHINVAFLLRGLQRFDEAEARARRVLELEPGSPTGYSLLGDLRLNAGDRLGHLVWYLKARRVDASDHELSNEIARVLGQLDEREAAEAWLAESRRQMPGNLGAETTAVMLAFHRGEMEATLDGALRLLSRHADERRGDWSSMFLDACLAARRLGRVEEWRSALTRERMLPRDYTLESVQGIATALVPVGHHVQHFNRWTPCLFAPEPAHAERRAEWAEALPRTLAPNVPAPWLAPVLAFLKGDPDGIIALQTRAPQPVDEVTRRRAVAEVLGFAADPRFQAMLERMDKVAAESKAGLRAALAAEGLSITP